MSANFIVNRVIACTMLVTALYSYICFTVGGFMLAVLLPTLIVGLVVFTMLFIYESRDYTGVLIRLYKENIFNTRIDNFIIPCREVNRNGIRKKKYSRIKLPFKVCPHEKFFIVPIGDKKLYNMLKSNRKYVHTGYKTIFMNVSESDTVYSCDREIYMDITDEHFAAKLKMVL